jgi:hypothetical protein
MISTIIDECKTRADNVGLSAGQCAKYNIVVKHFTSCFGLCGA